MSIPAVLLIDDNAVQAATRQTILRRAGYHAVAVLSAERALERFRDREFSEPIGLVITDHVMPGMDGAMFTRELRTFMPRLPVLVITGLEEAEALYQDLGVVFRVKPLLPDDLLATVQDLLRSSGTP